MDDQEKVLLRTGWTIWQTLLATTFQLHLWLRQVYSPGLQERQSLEGLEEAKK
jgi:hypothetical protein